MQLHDLFEGNEQAYNWHSEPEQRSMDATRQARLYREREPEGSEAIDARIRARYDQLDQYNQSGKFWLKQKDTQEHISDAMIGKAAANAAAVELLKQRPELKGNLVITAYGPGESQGVAEGEKSPMFKDSQKADRIRSLKNLIAIAREQGRQLRVQELELELKKLQGVAEGAGNIGSAIKSLYRKIYRAGDDEIEYFYNASPIFAQYWDEYEGDLDSIIAEVDPEELAVIKAELESYAQDANLAEAPGAETLSHNQSTVSKNLNSLDLGEGDISQLEKDVAAAPVAPIANMEADEKIGGRYDPDDFDAMVGRLKKLAGAGPMKTVWDPQKRVYKNVPTAVQPAQQPKK